MATVSINDTRVCFSIGVRRVGLPVLAAHIHQAPSGVNGDIVVPLTPPGADGTSGGCVRGVAALLRNQLLSDPAGFYVNVHTDAFPNGAVRGNLASVTL